jgi:hypothetical protein
MSHQQAGQSAIAKQIHPCLPTSLRAKKEKFSQLAVFKEALLQVQGRRSSVQNGYEKVIASLEAMVEELLVRNECLVQEKHALIKENCELRRQTESLSNIIEVKKRLGDSIVVDSSEIFEVMLVDSGTVERGTSKYEDSYECGNTIGNILEENSQVANRQEFIIMSHPLSQMGSDEGEISMSNIGQTHRVNQTNLQTPGLYKENIHIQCNSRHPDGVIRAFYLSVMQKRSTCRHLMEIIDSLRNDITTIIFEPYPTNDFWVEMLQNYLKLVHDGHFETQLEVLDYLKIHRLVDTLMIRCLKSRIEFLFYNQDSFEMPTVH